VKNARTMAKRVRVTRPDDDISRRVFVRRLAFVGTGTVLLGGCKKKEEAPAPAPARPRLKRPDVLTVSHQTFTDDEFKTLIAVVNRVIPRDQDPGAVEAGVPEYIDAALQMPQLKRMKRDFPPGLAALDRRCQRMHKLRYYEASPEQQDEVLEIFKDSPEASGEARWYEMLIVLTLEGFLGDPSYGGNKNEVGWQLVGFHLVDHAPKGDPQPGYDGKEHLLELRCGGKRGC